MAKMNSNHFDLNDIHHEPTDEQLEALMNSVADAARARAASAKDKLLQRLQSETQSAKQLEYQNERC